MSIILTKEMDKETSRYYRCPCCEYLCIEEKDDKCPVCNSEINWKEKNINDPN